jgi:hypothetical protein
MIRIGLVLQRKVAVLALENKKLLFGSYPLAPAVDWVKGIYGPIPCYVKTRTTTV